MRSVPTIAGRISIFVRADGCSTRRIIVGGERFVLPTDSVLQYSCSGNIEPWIRRIVSGGFQKSTRYDKYDVIWAEI